MLSDVLDQFRKLGITFLPPASDEEIDALAKAVEPSLPHDVRELYRNSNGLPQGQPRFQFRQMPIAEVLKMRSVFINLEWDEDVLILWADDNSNYAGVFIEGEDTGRSAFHFRCHN